MKKKSFTMLEVLLVVLILGILFSAYKNFFANDDKYFIQSQTCYNTVYGNLKNFLDDASSGKWYITGWNQTYFPTGYNINIYPSAQTGEVSIKLSYNYNWGVYDYKKIYLNKWANWSNPCESTNYKIKMTNTDVDSVSVMKMLQWNLNEQPFLINGDNNKITWNLTMTYCTMNDRCKALWVIMFDKRVWQIKLNRCLYREPRDANWNQQCKTRSLN